jgi:hypothetical protein
LLCFEKILTKSKYDAIITSRGFEIVMLMFNSEKAEKIINNQVPMDKKVIERVKESLAKKGIILIQSEEMDRFLMQRCAEAATLAPGDVIIIHTKVSASGFYEELIHYGQLKRGDFDIYSKTDNLKKEIEVLKNNLENYKLELEKIMSGGAENV